MIAPHVPGMDAETAVSVDSRTAQTSTRSTPPPAAATATASTKQIAAIRMDTARNIAPGVRPAHEKEYRDAVGAQQQRKRQGHRPFIRGKCQDQRKRQHQERPEVPYAVQVFLFRGIGDARDMRRQRKGGDRERARDLASHDGSGTEINQSAASRP